MHWTHRELQAVQLPPGKTKLTLVDPEGGGLYFEVRKRSRSFVFRISRGGKSVSQTIGQFPDVTIAEARQAARRLRRQDVADLKRAPVRDIRGPTLDAVVAEHFTEHSRRRHKHSKAVLAAYRIHVKPLFGNMRLGEITKVAVHQWINGLVARGLKFSTINKITMVFGQILGLAEDLEIPGAPERRKLGLKQMMARPTHTVFLKPKEAARLLAAVKNSTNADLEDIVAILLVTGARRSEALNARWEHIDFEGGLWLVPISKNGRPRYIQLCARALQILQARRATSDSPHVFPNPMTGEPYRCVWHTWNIARTEAGLPHVRLHDLRHSFASALVNEGVPLFDVQELLGHTSIKTTQRYAHLSKERLKTSVLQIDQVYGSR
jgi:integrase